MFRSRRELLAVVLAGVAAGIVGGCATPVTGPTSRSTATPGPTPAASFGGTDLAWIEVNVALNEQLLPLLDLVPRQSTTAALRALAAGVREFTAAELTALRRLHDQAGLPALNPHEGMPMPGMVLAADLAQASTWRGAAFDTWTVGKIREYLRQGISLAHSETTYGAEPRTRDLARAMTTARETTLSTLSK